MLHCAGIALLFCSCCTQTELIPSVQATLTFRNAACALQLLLNPTRGFLGDPDAGADRVQTSGSLPPARPESPAHTPAFPIILQQNCTVAPESIFKVSHARRTWNLEILCDRFDILRSLASSFKHGLDLASQAALAPAACSDFLVPWHSKHQQPSHRGMI